MVVFQVEGKVVSLTKQEGVSREGDRLSALKEQENLMVDVDKSAGECL